MAGIPLDLCEKILVRSDVEDLIRWKSVCKSWESLISSPRFVEAHLKHSCKNDRDNNGLGHRRITSYSDVFTHSWYYPGVNFYSENCNSSYIVGSCNGLVCVCVSSRDVELVVINPSTREEKKLQTPYLPDLGRIPLRMKLNCWGFGYDETTHDYKVILGFISEEQTLFHGLTLNSNTWRVIGAVNYLTDVYKAKSGILCGGALYWFMEHEMEDEDEEETQEVLISLDLSTDELKQIPQPSDKEEYLSDENHRLGVIEECLCIYSYDLKSFRDSHPAKWIMRNNKWEIYNDGDCESKYDIVHHLNLNSFCNYNKYYKKWIIRKLHLLSSHSFLDGDYCVGKYDDDDGGGGGGDDDDDDGDDDDDVYSCDRGKCTFNTRGYYLGASIFVKSLVSPHPHWRSKRNSKGQEGHGIVDSRGIRKRKRKRPCKQTPLVFKTSF